MPDHVAEQRSHSSTTDAESDQLKGDAQVVDVAAAQMALRRCLGQFPTGVTVITACESGNRIGMTANSFSSVSLDPPLILWSVRRASARALFFINAETFGISVLSTAQIDVARQFASTALDPFERTSWRSGKTGVPLIDGAVAHLECRRESVIDGGDHHIIIGRVVNHMVVEGTPLLFAQGQFALPRPHKDVLEALTCPDHASGVSSYPILRTLRKAHLALSDGFDDQRRALGLAPLSARILSSLEDGLASVDELARAASADGAAIQDVVNDLISQGFVVENSSSCYALSQRGAEKRREVAALAIKYAAERFADFTAEELVMLERLLARVAR